jgi:putative endonuclease
MIHKLTLKKQLGDLGEKIATNYLKKKGYQIIEQNYVNIGGIRLGEIDIIANDEKKNELIFVEVKTREFQKYGDTLPEENVDYRKMRKLERIAYFYLQQKKLLSHNYRFDVIAVWVDRGTRIAKVKHIKSI